MLAIQKQQKYFSKVMTMPNGLQALVVFELIEKNGHIVAKAIYAETLAGETVSPISAQEVILLKGSIASEHIAPVKSFYSNYVSPYFKDFSFFTSQLTRAPSYCS